jgi:hypothetical protein
MVHHPLHMNPKGQGSCHSGEADICKPAYLQHMLILVTKQLLERCRIASELRRRRRCRKGIPTVTCVQIAPAIMHSQSVHLRAKFDMPTKYMRCSSSLLRTRTGVLLNACSTIACTFPTLQSHTTLLHSAAGQRTMPSFTSDRRKIKSYCEPKVEDLTTMGVIHRLCSLVRTVNDTTEVSTSFRSWIAQDLTARDIEPHSIICACE